MKRPIEAILFDLDGTLIDTWEDLALSLNHVMSRLGRPARTPDEVRSFIGDGVRTLISRGLGEAATDELVEKGAAAFREHYSVHCADHARLFPGVKETLGRLEHRQIGIVTNKPLEPTRTLLKVVGVEKFFSEILAGDNFPVRKPSPEPLLEAARRLGTAPAVTMMVGDSPGDIQAGRDAGMTTCGVTFGYRPETAIRAAGPDFIASIFSDLVKFVS